MTHLKEQDIINGKFLKDTRKKMGISQAALAEKLYLTQSAVSLIEGGYRSMNAHYADNLARITGIPAGRFLGWENDGLTPMPNSPIGGIVSTLQDHPEHINAVTTYLKFLTWENKND